MPIAPYDGYNATNNRLKVQRAGITTYYIYDSNNNLLAEADQTKQITRHYLHGSGLHAMIQGNQAYVYHHSATGHTLAMTDNNETIINQYAYSPYGRLLGEMETSGLEQPFKYVGKYGVQHEGDELYYMRARYYDAGTGRFTMEDPIGIEGGLNVSLYGNANPVRYVDSQGTCPTGSEYEGQNIHSRKGYGWTRPQGHKNVVGRAGHDWVYPGPRSGVGQFIDDYVPAGHTFGTNHDAFVGFAVNHMGLPDPVVNIPSMLPIYILSVGQELVNTTANFVNSGVNTLFGTNFGIPFEHTHNSTP